MISLNLVNCYSRLSICCNKGFEKTLSVGELELFEEVLEVLNVAEIKAPRVESIRINSIEPNEISEISRDTALRSQVMILLEVVSNLLLNQHILVNILSFCDPLQVKY